MTSVSSPLHFDFAQDYTKGGSLIYQGAEGVLKWTYTGGSDRFIDGRQTVGQGGGTFTLRGVEVIDLTASSSHFMDMTGVSDLAPFDKVSVENCTITDFKAGIHTEDVLIVEMKNVTISQPTATPSENSCFFLGPQSIVMESCDIEVNSTSIHPLRIEPAVSAVIAETYQITKSIFRRPSGSTAEAIRYDAFIEPASFALFEGCVSLVDGVVAGPGFEIISQGGIKSITDPSVGSEIEIETFQDHNLSMNDSVMTWGALDPNYNLIDVNVNDVVSARKFRVSSTFGSNNYSGFFRKGGFDGYSSKNIIVKNGLGFLDSK